MNRTQYFRFAVLFALLVIAGCGGDSPRTTTGIVSVQGTPLPDTMVTFTPVAEGDVAIAYTDKEGYFRAATGENDGVRPGEYKVTFAMTAPVVLNDIDASIKAANVKDESDVDAAMMPRRKSDEEEEPPNPLPFHSQYTNITTTPLTVTIPADEFAFELEPPEPPETEED